MAIQFMTEQQYIDRVLDGLGDDIIAVARLTVEAGYHNGQTVPECMANIRTTLQAKPELAVGPDEIGKRPWLVVRADRPDLDQIVAEADRLSEYGRNAPGGMQ